MTVFLELVGVAALILLNGFFVAAEYSLVTVRRTRLKELVDEGNRPARAVMTITSDPPHFIAAMQLGVTLTSLAIGAIGEAVLSDLFGIYLGTFVAVVLAFLVITFMHVVVGELVPKGLALSYSERIALGVSVPVRAFFFVAAPLIWVLQRSSEGAQRLIGIDPDYTDGEVHSEAELKMLLEVSTQRGEIEQGEREMLYKVFDFADKEASDVMVPRPEVVGISVEMAPEEALRAVLESPYTRYPVFRESLDEIVGILHVRDLVSALHDSAIAEVAARRAPAPRLRRAGDEGPRRAAGGVPAHEPAHVGRRRRVRRDAGDRHAGGPARGDRGRDRGRVRPAGRVDRADQRDDDPDRRDVPDRRLQRGARNLARARGLPHGRRVRLRPARPRGRAGRRGPARRAALHGARRRGVADPASRGRVPAGARDAGDPEGEAA